jgi:hypothetical protein
MAYPFLVCCISQPQADSYELDNAQNGFLPSQFRIDLVIPITLLLFHLSTIMAIPPWQYLRSSRSMGSIHVDKLALNQHWSTNNPTSPIR